MNRAEGKPIKESTRQVDAVTKALGILDCFARAEPELSLKRLSEKTGLYKSRILRLCGTLTAQGYLIRTPTSAYKLGPKLMILGKAYEATNPLSSVARPVLKRLSALTGESTKLFVIEGTNRLCLVREKGTSPLQYAINEGETQPLYAGAGGKLLLAYAPATLLHEVLHHSLEGHTPNTIVDRDKLEEELDTIRRQGYAFSKGELVPEVAGLSAPVYAHDGAVCAALTIAGAEQRFSGQRKEQMLAQLLDAARELSVLLGHQGRS